MPPAAPSASTTSSGPAARNTPGSRPPAIPSSGTAGTARTPGTPGTRGTRGTRGTAGTARTARTPGTRGTRGTRRTSGTSGTAGASGTLGASGTTEAPAPDPVAPAPDPVAPVRPAKPVAARPVVRPVAVPDEVAGVPCPDCGTLNSPERRFCRRCAAVLKPAETLARLPWWRTVWPLRRRVRAGSGRAVRFLVILAVVVALCAGGVLLLPAGRALFEDTRDKLGKPKAVTPVSVKASAEIPRHPATNTTDGLKDRYWGAPAPGASVTYTFREPFRLVDLIIINGASFSPEEYGRQARALRLDMEVTTQDGEKHEKVLTLSDKAGPQTIPTGISDVKTVRLVLRSPAGLTAGRHLALAEVEFFERS